MAPILISFTLGARNLHACKMILSRLVFLIPKSCERAGEGKGNDRVLLYARKSGERVFASEQFGVNDMVSSPQAHQRDSEPKILKVER